MKTDRPSIVTYDVLEGCSRPNRTYLGVALCPETLGGCVGSGSPDWSMAVRVAAARLEEHFGTLDHPVVATLANELAALLCAYGMIEEEHDRMRARQGFTVASQFSSAQSVSGQLGSGQSGCGQSDSAAPEPPADRRRQGPRRYDGGETHHNNLVEDMDTFKERIAEYL